MLSSVDVFGDDQKTKSTIGKACKRDFQIITTIFDDICITWVDFIHYNFHKFRKMKEI